MDNIDSKLNQKLPKVLLPENSNAIDWNQRVVSSVNLYRLAVRGLVNDQNTISSTVNSIVIPELIEKEALQSIQNSTATTTTAATTTYNSVTSNGIVNTSADNNSGNADAAVDDGDDDVDNSVRHDGSGTSGASTSHKHIELNETLASRDHVAEVGANRRAKRVELRRQAVAAAVSASNGTHTTSLQPQTLYLKSLDPKIYDLQRALRKRVLNVMRKRVLHEAIRDYESYRLPQDKHIGGLLTSNVNSSISVALGFAGLASHDNQVSRRKFLGEVLARRSEMLLAHRSLNLMLTAVAKQTSSSVQSARRREENRAMREEKERLRALKNNDEEAYAQLVSQTKNQRLKDLLAQTDNYLRRLGAMVALERAEDFDAGGKPRGRSKAAREARAQAKAEEAARLEARVNEMKEASGDAVPGTRDGNYYQLAHAVSETVVQPDILQGGQLRDYQMAGLSWLVSLYNNKLNGVLADEMGLGKTIQTIALVAYLIEKKHQKGPFLVCVPLSTVENWSFEFEKWAPSINVVTYIGSPDRRREIHRDEIAPGRFNVVITTPEYVMRDAKNLKTIRWFYLIVDEGHRMKNSKSKLSQVFKQNYHTYRRLILTGTPLHNNLPELWSLLNFLLPRIFASQFDFQQWFNAPFAGHESDLKLSEEEELLIIRRLHKVLRPFLLRRLKADVESQLLDKVERVIRCDMSALQRVMYTRMLEKSVMLIGNSGKVQKRSLMNTLMQLRKIVNHPFLFNEDNWPIDENIVRQSGKFLMLDRVLGKLKAAGHRVLLFSQFTSVMDIIEDYCELRSYKFLRLDGSTKSTERTERMRLYNAPDSEYFLFILSTRAGGYGINLQTADTVILFDSDWNPQTDLQAQDRAHRIGQRAEVRVLRFITAHSVEEKILERAMFKLGIDQKVIGAGMFNNQATGEDRRAMLEALLRDANKGKEDSNNKGDDNDDDDDDGGGDEAKDATNDDVDPDLEPYDDNHVNEALARMNDEERKIAEAKAVANGADADDRRSLNDACQRVLDVHALAEYRLFSQLDEQRRASPHNIELLNEEELPFWAQKAADEELEEAEVAEQRSYGRGHRKRGDVIYHDVLSEDQWLRVVDRGDDPAAVARRALKRKQSEESSLSSGRARKSHRVDHDADDDIEDKLYEN